MTWLPTFEAQTVASIIIGALISVATYWLGQRRVKGAEQERISALNAQLVSAVIRRVAVDRQVMPEEHYEYVHSAKAQEAGINRSLLLSFDKAKARVFSAVIENDFLDVPSKNAIIELLAASTSAGGMPETLLEKDKPQTAYLYRTNALLLLISLSAGALTSIIAYSDTFSSIFANPTSSGSKSSSWLEILLLGAMAIFVGVRLYFVLGPRQRIEKEASQSDIRSDQ